MRSAIVGLYVLLGMCAPAGAAVSIGINVGVYPELVPVPGYPVLHAPQLDSNFFFYDGFYWVYAQDTWYSSPWYNGPWDAASPEIVPLFVLRVPVRYYRQPPAYFRAWSLEGSPRWGEHWGHGWEQHRNGWDHWDHGAAPARAPLPDYQRSYSGDRYPRPDQQLTLRNEHYRYQPHDVPTPARPVHQQPLAQAGDLAQRRVLPAGSSRSGPPRGNAGSTRVSTSAAVDVADPRRSSRAPPLARGGDVTAPVAAGRARPPQDTQTQSNDGRPEPEPLRSRGAQAAPPAPRTSQPAHSPDRNETPAPNAAAEQPKREADHGH